MEHPGSQGLRRETLLLVAGLDQTTLDSPALDSQVLGPALDLDQDQALEDLFQEGLDLEDLFQEGLDLDQDQALEDLFQEGLDLGIPWVIPSMTIVTPTHSVHPWHPSRPHVLPQHDDREQPRGLDVPPKGRGQPPNPH
jgi:hypothetical protein